jgi:hypothetical protein
MAIYTQHDSSSIPDGKDLSAEIEMLLHEIEELDKAMQRGRQAFITLGHCKWDDNDLSNLHDLVKAYISMTTILVIASRALPNCLRRVEFCREKDLDIRLSDALEKLQTLDALYQDMTDGQGIICIAFLQYKILAALEASNG